MKNIRFGIIVPWMNTTVEDELFSSVHESVGLHFARITPNSLPKNSHDESYLLSMYHDIDRAHRSFIGIELEAIFVACTSLSFSESVPLELEKNASKHDCITVQDTLIECLNQHKERPNYLCGPYSQQILLSGAESLRNDGIEIKDVFPISYKKEIRDISTQELVNFIVSLNLEKGSNLILSCTALYTSDLEQSLIRVGRDDINLITSNQSIIRYINERQANFQ